MAEESPTKSYGLVIPKIETRLEGAEHTLGSIGAPIINAEGNWIPYLPDREPQSKNGVETQACTVYGTLSALETLVFFHTGKQVNYSDRYIANVAKNRGILDPHGGADPHKIAELIREISGNLREERCAWTADLDTVDKYYSLVGRELADLMLEGTEWYKEWELKHLWVWSGNPTPAQKRELIQEALKRGTVCTSVYAWNAQGPIYVKPQGAGDNHWQMTAQAKGNEPYDDFDSYDTYLKRLDPLFDFSLAKVYYLTPVAHLFLKNLGWQMTDPEVMELQKALLQLGYTIPHAVTSVYGNETRNALFKFQLDHSIADDGSHFGPRTRQAMNTVLNPSAPFGGSLITYILSFFSGV